MFISCYTKGEIMKFDDLDKQMRIYEQNLDQYIVPGMYIVARLDGRSFTKLTHEKLKFEAPFDSSFRNHMVATVKHLMNCGFKILYAYTESDEISLLFSTEDQAFSHKVRKLNTILAGEASGVMSLRLGVPVCFDCRIIPLPNRELVKDYFSWRQEDANRNALNSWAYWTLRKDDKSRRRASSMLKGISVADKNELLYKYGINYNDVPLWQKRGVGLYYRIMNKEGFNPLTKEKVTVKRNVLYIDYELPCRDEYEGFIDSLLRKDQKEA